MCSIYYVFPDSYRLDLVPQLSENILAEATTGLHFEDVKKLLEVLRRLVVGGNTVLVIGRFTKPSKLDVDH